MLLTIVIFIITLLILVVLHELGHFVMAKKFGIKVEEFGFGIPPRAWGKKVGETLVSINWLPLGGFVRLYGEDESDSKILKDKRSFASQTVGKRIIVVIAGVVMNLILAWILFYIVFIAQGFKTNAPSVIEHRFTGVDQTSEYLAEVTKVADNSPAKQAGIKEQDRIIAVNGVPLNKTGEFSNEIKQQSGKEITITLSDIDKHNYRDVKVTPRINPPAGEGALGIAYGEDTFVNLEYKTVPQKLFSAVSFSWDIVQMTFLGLGKLFFDLTHQNFQAASQTVSGPVGLVNAANQIISIGDPIAYLNFMALISLTLAIFNFLPIPALDGGRLLFFYIEAILRKRVVTPELESKIHAVGFMVLLALMVLVTYSDIRKLF